MSKKSTIENRLLKAYLAGYQAGINAMRKRAGEVDIIPDQTVPLWQECSYLSERGDGCLGTKEVDPCQKEKCEHIHLKKKERR